MEERVPMSQDPTPRKLSPLSALMALAPLLLAACASSPTGTGASRGDTLAAPQPTSAMAPASPAPAASSAPHAMSMREAENRSMAALGDLLEDSMNPGARVDLQAPLAHVDLWARIRTGLAMPELDNDLVRKAENWYAERPDYVARMTERGGRYLYHIVEEVEKRGMPTELALLPFIESAFRTDAQSSAKAVGMWQFMPATGRDFDLKQNIFRDDRRDVLASTRAALDYLQRLAKMFDGDWQLALAAYNWGQGNVAKAIARNQRAGLPTDYDSIKMPDETRYYLPKLQAVKNIVLRPEAFGLALPAMANHPYFLSVKIDRDMDVTRAAQLAGMSEEDFRLFNPQMNKPVILAASSGQILLPYDNAAIFIGQLAAHQGPLASWTAWVVPKTMKPADAAKLVGMSETGLRELNRIPPRMLVKQGSTLLVPRSGQRDRDVSEHLADHANLALAPDVPPLRRVSLKAGKGESVASVARRYGLSTTQVAQWNKVGAKASFKPGQSVVVYLAPGSGAKPTATRVASSKAKAPVRRSAAKASVRVAGGGGSTVSARTSLR
jgi:membrane-bound lytic murein transglycosylase D